MQYCFILIFLATSALALKSPKLCPNGQGNEFVCSVIETVNKDESYSNFTSISEITIGQNGQEELYNSTKALEVLRGSLRTQTNSEALKTTDPFSWFKILANVAGQLENTKSGTEELVTKIASGLTNLQSSFDNTVAANNKTVEETASKATEKLSEQVDQKAITFLKDEYSEAVEKCKSSVSKQVETLQDRTKKFVEKSYDSLIDLTDQIGLCIQSKDTKGKCARTVQIKLNGLRSLEKIAELNASNFERIGKKSFEKDLCLRIALKRFVDNIKKVLKTAPQKQ